MKRSVEGPTWAPPPEREPRPDWLSAIDGLWPALEARLANRITERQPGLGADAVRAATLDSLRAIMMIRAYRMRGHLAANLDPLGLAEREDASELDPASYGFAESDYDRSIFLDFVLGLETSTIREIHAILQRTYCGNVGVQYMHHRHLKSRREGLAAGTDRGAATRRSSSLPARARSPSSRS